LENEYHLLEKDIGTLKNAIFQSDKYLDMDVKVKNLEVEKEKLIMEEKYTSSEYKILSEQKTQLDAQNKQLEQTINFMKDEIERKQDEVVDKQEKFQKQFDREVKSLGGKDLTDAKERRQIRTNKNNELEEMWNIKKIEMRKQRDKFYNENEEKKELQHQHCKLDEAYKDQAQEISNFKHRITELMMGIEEKNDSIETLVKDNSDLTSQESTCEDMITRLTTEHIELSKKDRLDSEIEKMDVGKLLT